MCGSSSAPGAQRERNNNSRLQPHSARMQTAPLQRRQSRKTLSPSGHHRSSLCGARPCRRSAWPENKIKLTVTIKHQRSADWRFPAAKNRLRASVLASMCMCANMCTIGLCIPPSPEGWSLHVTVGWTLPSCHMASAKGCYVHIERSIP